MMLYLNQLSPWFDLQDLKIPTAEVELCPVGVNVKSEIAVGDPTVDVADNPVNPITSAGTK